MQAINIEFGRGGSQTLPSLSRRNITAAAAFENLQTAILRLASKPPARPGSFGRQEIGALVEQALDAYRQYMLTLDSKELAT